MAWVALVVVAGYLLYVLRPDERRRLVEKADHAIGGAWHALQVRRGQPDAFRDALKARTRAPFVTAAIVLTNLAVFALIAASPGRIGDHDTIVRWGGSVGPLTTNGEWWRLVSATFVHAGVLQLLIDVAALTQAAMLVERMCGHLTLAGIYVTSAVFAAAIGLSAEPLTVHSGAVGAVFGIHGVLVAMLVRGTVQRSPITIPVRRLGGVAAAAAVFVAYYMPADGAQWTAGLATFVTGFALGLALTRNVAVRKPPARRVLSLATTALAMTAVIAAPLSGMTDIRSHVAGLIALETRTAAAYDAAVERFRTGKLKADGLAQVIDQAIVPELRTGMERLNAVDGVPPQQQPLVAGANAYLRLRCQSWVIRATALHTANWRLLREADEKERASLDALEKLKPAIRGAG